MTERDPDVLDRKVAALRQAMGPVIAKALADRMVVEVMVNPDGRIWIDRIGEGRSWTGELLAAAIAERDEGWKQFAGYGLPSTRRPAGFAAAQASYWWHGFNDWLKSRLEG